MNSAQHTPGPWRFIQADNLIVGGDGGRLATGWSCRSLDYSPEVRDANARLIAAAPELLEALRQANEESKLHDQHPGRWGHVIAKATGSQP